MRIFSSMVTETPMRPSSSIIVVTSCRCGTFDTVTGPSASRQPGEDGQRRILGARDADLALERDAAVNLQLIHEPRSPGSRTPPACKPAARARGSRCPSAAPSVAYTSLMALHGAQARRTRRRSPPPRNARCPRSPPTARLPGKPSWMSCATVSGFMPLLKSPSLPVSFADESLTTRTKASSSSGARRSNVEIDGLRAQLPRLGYGVCTRLPDLS